MPIRDIVTVTLFDEPDITAVQISFVFPQITAKITEIKQMMLNDFPSINTSKKGE
jgi:predicted amino acid-binding ACT domain protein